MPLTFPTWGLDVEKPEAPASPPPVVIQQDGASKTLWIILVILIWIAYKAGKMKYKRGGKRQLLWNLYRSPYHAF